VSIYNWKEKLEKLDKSGLQSGAKTDSERELKLLRRENEVLKSIVAEKELAIQIKDSLLKKVNQ
jgi:putative transposase